MSTLLHRLRLERGYSTRALAAEVGVSGPTIHHIEHGRRPTPHPRTCAALERVMGLPLDVLLMPDTTNAADPVGADGAGTKTAADPAEDREEVTHGG